MRLVYLSLGFFSVALGLIGIALPLVPTVPFMLLATFFFARSNPRWEAKLLADPRFGPHIRAWRERRAIGRAGKIAAIVGLTGSGIGGLLLLDGPWRFAPIAVAVICGSWIASRPDA
ncbi:MAG: YbaN family protein [Sphingomonadaceae bacterium]